MHDRQSLEHEMKQRLEQRDIKDQRREMNPWTSKAKKNTVVTFEVDGKKTSLPIVAFLKQEALKLPPMMQNGKRVVHFDQLWWHFMHGNTKAESQQAVNDYCAEVVDIWNKKVQSTMDELMGQNQEDDEDYD